jgi:type I restriction-modification system DNA methylase subunit
MLPLTVLRRLDCVLEPTKDKVLARQKELAGGKVKNIDRQVNRSVTKQDKPVEFVQKRNLPKILTTPSQGIVFDSEIVTFLF